MRVLASILLMLAASATIPAEALSCGDFHPREELQYAKAALTGEVIARQDEHIGIRVDQDLFGNLPAVIQVADEHTSTWWPEVGAEIGLILPEQGPPWKASACALIHDSLVRAATTPLPDARGPARLGAVLAAEMGEATTVALDPNGTPIAYATDGGEMLDLCPGGRVLVEYAADDLVGLSGRSTGRAETIARDLETFRVRARHRVHEMEQREDLDPAVTEVRCLDPSGSRVALAARLIDNYEGTERALITVLDRGSVQISIELPESPIALGRDAAYHVDERGELRAVDLDTGERRRVLRLGRDVTDIASSRDGRQLAALRYPTDKPLHGTLMVIDPQDRRVSASNSIRVARSGTTFEHIRWAPSDLIILSTDAATFYDATANEVERVMRPAGHSTSMNGHFYVDRGPNYVVAISTFRSGEEPASWPDLYASAYDFLPIPNSVEVVTQRIAAPLPRGRLVDEPRKTSSRPASLLSLAVVIAAVGAIRHRSSLRRGGSAASRT